MTSDACILDGYVDEPTCLGVSPYISPYVRYVAGVLKDHEKSVGYVTIDQVRKDPALFDRLNGSELVVMIAGITVPGKYLGGTPATLTEIRQIGNALKKPVTCIGGPISFGYSPGGGTRAERQENFGFDVTLAGEIAPALDSYLNGGEPAGMLEYSELDRWSVRGSGIIRDHPSFPHVMCELETARGCSRAISGGCSFCTEPFYGLPRYRSSEGIFAEVKALHDAGAVHFRLGRQPDLLTYGTKGGEFPKPSPEILEGLFIGIRDSAPGLRTLHIDNINPGTVARHEAEAREGLAVITRYHTPGDVAAFGMETADQAVISANNLKATPGEVMRAIEVVNEVGAQRKDGVPDLLPGLNFIIGLPGETLQTFEKNERFLHEVLRRGLLVRRVNIRQLMPFEGTPAYDQNTLGLHRERFRQFKDTVRTGFDLPMLRRVFPVGCVLRDVIVEKPGPVSFGRQMGSYPILVGFPMHLPFHRVLDAVVVDWGMRSISALPVPVLVNTLPVSALRWIPGIGKKKAGLIAAKRPFSSREEFRTLVGETLIDDVIRF